MKLLPTNTKLGEESKQQLTELGNKLKPYLKAYQESRGAIAHIYTHWKTTAKEGAKKYAEQFMQDIGISKGYLSKLKTVNDFRQNLIDSGEPASFVNWYESQGIYNQYEMTKIILKDLVMLWQNEMNVSRETLKALKANCLGDTRRKDEKDDQGLSELKRFINLDNERVGFLKQCIINEKELPLINDLYLAHCWSSLSEESLLTLIKQKISIKPRTELTLFESKLRQIMIEEMDYRESLKAKQQTHPTTTN